MPDVEEIGAVVAVTESEFERYAVELRQKLIEHLQRGDALRRTSTAVNGYLQESTMDGGIVSPLRLHDCPKH